MESADERRERLTREALARIVSNIEAIASHLADGERGPRWVDQQAQRLESIGWLESIIASDERFIAAIQRGDYDQPPLE